MVRVLVFRLATVRLLSRTTRPTSKLDSAKTSLLSEVADGTAVSFFVRVDSEALNSASSESNKSLVALSGGSRIKHTIKMSNMNRI